MAILTRKTNRIQNQFSTSTFVCTPLLFMAIVSMLVTDSDATKSPDCHFEEITKTLSCWNGERNYLQKNYLPKIRQIDFQVENEHPVFNSSYFVPTMSNLKSIQIACQPQHSFELEPDTFQNIDQESLNIVSLDRLVFNFSEPLIFLNRFTKLQSLTIANASNSRREIALETPLLNKNVSHSVRVLYLMGNKLKSIEKDYFQDYPSMEVLDLRGNLFCKIPDCFKEMMPSRGINLNENKITEVRSTDFTAEGSVIWLELDGNRLRKIDIRHGMVRSRISINNNKDLKCLPDNIFIGVDEIFASNTSLSDINFLGGDQKLKVYLLDNSDLSCSCEIEQIKRKASIAILIASCWWGDRQYDLYSKDDLKEVVPKWEDPKEGCKSVSTKARSTPNECGYLSIPKC